MEIRFNRKILVLLVCICLLLLSGCDGKFSTSNPDIEKLSLKAKELMDKEEYAEAIGRLESINDLNPNLAENYYNLGIAYYKSGQAEKALQSLQKAVNLDNTIKDAYYTMAVIYEELASKVIEENKGLKQTGSGQIADQLSKNYKNSLDCYISYLKFCNDNEEKDKLMKKIQELTVESNKYNITESK
jgi:tetratricopeptide (TPR) repeat protein